VDKKGSVYVVGSSRSATRSEFVTIKYTMNGKEQWVARLSEPREKWFLLSYVKTDVEGNAYVTTEMDPAWLGPSYSSARYLESELSEFVTVKYNPRGKEEWRAKYRAPHGQRISLRGMMIAGGGDVLVVGLNQRNPFDAGMLVITYDAKGNEKEVKRFETVPELVRFLGQLSLR